MNSQALAPIEHAPLPAPSQPDAPLPVFRGQQMAQALVAYKELQGALDRAMPDQLMAIEGRTFRKKGYWRAVAVAFNLTVEPVSEKREVYGQFEDGRDNFGYIVTYRAVAPNGRSEPGDGACFALEKAAKFKCQHPHPKGWKGKSEHWPHETCPAFDPLFQWQRLPSQATEHNVRSHAHTRAYNRAVSNLCGFGEVSAEEVERGTEPPPDFIMGESEPTPELVVPRIALPAGTFQILAVRMLKFGGEVRVVDEKGAEATYPTPDEQCVKLAEQLFQEHAPVTLERVKGKRDQIVKIKGIHRYQPPTEPSAAENAALDAEIVAKEAGAF